VVRTYVPAQSMEEQWDLPGLDRVLSDEWKLDAGMVAWVSASDAVDDEDVLARVQQLADDAYTAKTAQVGEQQFASFERMVLLQSLDSHWREHLAALDYLRQGIHLRGYAQKNPKQEYKREAFELFGQLLDVVKLDVTRLLMTVRIDNPAEAEQAAQAIETQGETLHNVTYVHPNEDGSVSADTDAATLAESVPAVGRNEPCPCGSGRKYKHCHGKLV
jgi:preprotein translocase subunit SecA